jgi:C4-dicarboxylate transporter, DctM subunit
VEITIVFGVLISLIIIGVPVAFSMALGTIIAYYFVGSWTFVAVLSQRMYEGSTSFVLLAIPFFILTGYLMNEGGATRRIIDSVTVFLGRIRGGMGQVNVGASMLFSGISGSAVADASGLGLVELKLMREAGYDEEFSAAITAASSTIGPIIPPSIPFVVYGAITGTSVARMFAAGLLPGVLMGISLMIAVYIVAVKRDYPTITVPLNLRVVSKALWDALFPLGNIAIILFGIMSGAFTPTEAAIAAAAYALLINRFVFRELPLARIVSALRNTVVITTKIMFVIATANAYAYALVLLRVPEQLAAAMGSFAQNPWLFLLSLNAILLLLGCFMEGLSIMILVIPIIHPIAIGLGISSVHLGVVITLNTMLGLLSPPLGLSLYAVASVSTASVQDIIKEIWPYFLALLVVLIATTYIPSAVMFLPDLIFG